ncbi:MAG: hypothetical protein R2748_08225 [Bryobacterales bacterium]
MARHAGRRYRAVPLLTELQHFYTPETAADLQREQPELLYHDILTANRSLIDLIDFTLHLPSPSGWCATTSSRDRSRSATTAFTAWSGRTSAARAS